MHLHETAVLSNFIFLTFLVLLALIFAVVAILYVGLEGDIFVFPTIFCLQHTKTVTVEPQYSEPLYLYNEVLSTTNNFLYSRNSQINEKEP